MAVAQRDWSAPPQRLVSGDVQKPPLYPPLLDPLPDLRPATATRRFTNPSRGSFVPGHQSDARSEASIEMASAALRAALAKRGGGKKRSRKSAPGGAVVHGYAAAMLWRRRWQERGTPGTTRQCGTPLYSLSQPAERATPAEVEAAANALARGIPYSEWFACNRYWDSDPSEE